MAVNPDTCFALVAGAPVGKLGTDHQERITAFKGVLGGRVSYQPRLANLMDVAVVEPFLGFQRQDHGGSQLPGDLEYRLFCVPSPHPYEQGDTGSLLKKEGSGMGP